MTMITPSYLGETIEYSSLHACRSTLEDPTYRRSCRCPACDTCETEPLATPIHLGLSLCPSPDIPAAGPFEVVARNWWHGRSRSKSVVPFDL